MIASHNQYKLTVDDETGKERLNVKKMKEPKAILSKMVKLDLVCKAPTEGASLGEETKIGCPFGQHFPSDSGLFRACSVSRPLIGFTESRGLDAV